MSNIGKCGRDTPPLNEVFTPANKLTFIAVDIETTGLTPVVDRIVEIGAVKFRSGKVLDRFQKLIDPEMPISPGAFAVNGITDEMVRGRPTIEEILPEFMDFVGDAVPIAHNAPFDVGFLSYDISRLNLVASDKPILDTCSIPKRVFPYFHSYSLENLARDLGIRSEGFHRALEDANVCRRIFLKCVDEMGGHNHVTLEQIFEANGPCLSFKSGEILLEGPFHSLKEALESEIGVRIVYRDARGSISVREITPLSVGLFHGTTMIEAFCHLRQDKRNFRLDRILEIR